MQEAFLPWQSLRSNSGYQIATLSRHRRGGEPAVKMLDGGTMRAGAESRPYEKQCGRGGVISPPVGLGGNLVRDRHGLPCTPRDDNIGRGRVGRDRSPALTALESGGRRRRRVGP